MAKQIYFQGYEGLREMVEVNYPGDLDAAVGGPMDYRSIIPVKGLGRLSVILFGIARLYLHKGDLDAKDINDFCRSGVFPAGLGLKNLS